ncbi:MAG: ferrochelatase [Saprospiraceae bacterium]
MPVNLNSKIGVLLVNLGTPDDPSYGGVWRYLQQFLTDGRVIDIPWLPRQLLVRGIIAPFRSNSSSKLYKQLWTENGSPLKFYGERLAAGVQKNLGSDYIVELAMRYQNPSIESALDKLMSKQVRELIVIPLFPHYASASTGSVYEEVMRLLSKKQAIPSLKIVNSFHDYEPMIDVFVKNSQKYDLSSYDHILFSYHGLPQRQMKKADTCNHCLKVDDCCAVLSEKNQFCYSAQCHDTTYALAEKLNLSRDQYTICFQSRLGRDPWIQPYTSDILKVRADAGDKRLLVFCPAFVSDCLETTIEILDEYQEEFEELGGEHIDLVESLNDHPDWIIGMSDLVRAQVVEKQSSVV